MREKFDAALKAAIAAQDKRRMSTLRLIKAAVKDRDNAARSNGKDGVSDAEVLNILSKMVEQRRESVKSYADSGRLELAQQEQEEIDIIRDFLPKQLSEEETRQACREVMNELGCGGLKDMGRTMGTLKQRYAGRMNFSRASQIVKELLK